MKGKAPAEFVGRVFEGDEGPLAISLFERQAGSTSLPEQAPVPGAPIGAVVRVSLGENGTSFELLATGDGPLSALYEILAKYGLNPIFPAEVMAETEAWIQSNGLDDPELEDLTNRAFVTIDGASSKDLDQAVFVESSGSGWVVHYALADASYYVPQGSALWREAEKRAASYYLPGLMVPMLPRALSEGLVSLNPDVERRALVFRLELDATGRATLTTARRAKIRSRHKLSFERVERFFDDDERFDDPDVNHSLSLLRRVGEARLREARQRNVVRYRRTELEATIGGKVTRRFIATSAVRREVEAYNEQLSLLCNIEGAKLLRQAVDQPYVEAIYRVHPAPAPERLEELRTLIAAIVGAHALPAKPWLWKPDQTLSDYLEALPSRGAHSRVSHAVHRQAVMVNVRSSYQQAPASHFGVGAEVYARFSAPMRELVGIYLHAELMQALSREGTTNQALTDLVVERANHAKQVQKQISNAANLLVLDQLFADQLLLPEGQRGLDASLMGMSKSKLYVEFDEPPIDAKIRVRDIRNHLGSEDVYVASDECQLKHGQRTLCRIGDPVRVIVLAHEKSGRWALALRPADA